MIPANAVLRSEAIKYFRPELLLSKNSSDEKTMESSVFRREQNYHPYYFNTD
jgi:hypothetical protein